MASPTKDSSTIINQQEQGQGQGQGQGQEHDDGGNGDVGNNPIVGYGSSLITREPTTQANETDQTQTSTEVAQTPPESSPTLPVITSSGGVCEIASHAMDLPPPPPFIPPAATNVVASSGRKRGRPSSGYGEELSSSSSTPRKSSRGDYTCIVCGREFSTDKSYYGHLRKHPERVWRGAYPPRVPVLEVKRSGPTPLELANQTSARILSGRGPSSTSYSSSRGSLGIDLNNPPPPPPTSADDRAPLLPFDLNMPPPIENDEEEEEEEKDPDNGGSSAQ